MAKIVGNEVAKMVGNEVANCMLMRWINSWG